jgi:hypothetical protein
MIKSHWIYYNIDMINFFIHELLKFINKNNTSFTLNTDLETFYDNFVHFLYHNYYLNLDIEECEYDNNLDYFQGMYESDIIDLFSEFKDIADGFTSDIFKKRNESYSLLEFIYDNINLEEDYNIIDELSDDEYVEEEYY